MEDVKINTLNAISLCGPHRPSARRSARERAVLTGSSGDFHTFPKNARRASILSTSTVVTDRRSYVDDDRGNGAGSSEKMNLRPRSFANFAGCVR